MKILWCCYCKRNVPMLDEDEAALVWTHFNELEAVDTREAMLDAYNRMTGSNETHWTVIFEHRISKWGPPCPRCGKVLRTPLAYKCFECGYIVRPPTAVQPMQSQREC